MTAETFTASVAKNFYLLCEEEGGSYVLTSTAVTALGALTTSSTVSDGYSQHRCWEPHVVSGTGIGFAAALMPDGCP